MIRLSSLAIQPLQERIPLWKLADDISVVAKNGTLSSMIELVGISHELGHGQLVAHAESLRLLLSPLLSDPDQSIELAFRKCAQSAAALIERSCLDSRKTAERMNLDLHDLIESRRVARAGSMSPETSLMIIYTPPLAARTGRLFRRGVPGAGGMARGNDLERDGLLRHRTAVEALARDLVINGHICRILDGYDYIQEVGSALYPLHPCHDCAAETRFAHVTKSGIDRSLATEPVKLIDGATLSTPSSIISGFDITLVPERFLPFNDLVKSISAALPSSSWRCSFKYHARGLSRHQLREHYVRLLTFTNRVRHQRMRDAYDQLREVDGSTDTVIQLQMCFALWSDIARSTRHMDAFSVMRRCVEQWGGCITDCLTGDPLSTVLASVPGMAPGSTASVSAAPLGSALGMAPIARRCSPWPSGEILLQTPDGRPWPYQRGSSIQNSWVEIMIGSSGTGKSVAMNAFNLETVLDSRNNATDGGRVPRISIIDVGGSSKSLVDLVREGLPPERQFEAVYIRLKMLPEHSINVFDTPLGCRGPTSAGRAFLINFLSILLDRKSAHGEFDVSGMIGGIVDLAYDQVSDHRDPKRFSTGEVPEVDRGLASSGFMLSESTTWWNITDWLYRTGKRHLARLAQTRAVPTLPDLLTATLDHQMRITYGTGGDENCPISGIRTAISEAVRDMPSLSMATRFSIAGARIVVVDLDEVTNWGNDESGERMSALMYMVARNAVMSEWTMDREDVHAMAASETMPEFYSGFHLDRIATGLVAPKQVCMDEFHRVGQVRGVRKQVLQDMREGRKRNMRITLASQYAEDFSGGLLESASSVFLFNTPSPESMAWLSRQFALTEHDRSLVSTWLTGPGPDGAPIFGMFSTRNGQANQKLRLKLSPSEIWALTSTAEDVHLRRLLYTRIDSSKARQALANRFPSGSAKREIDRYHSVHGHTSPTDDSRDVYDRLVDELLADWG